MVFHPYDLSVISNPGGSLLVADVIEGAIQYALPSSKIYLVPAENL
jgi:hypothetical protein